MGISEAAKKELEDNLNKALEKETPESCNKFLDEQKNANKVEPRFKVGDWVVIDGEVLHVKEVTEDGYLTDEGGLIPFRNEKEAHIWTIQDAKDGDVLACENDIVIFKENSYNPKDKSGCMFVYCSCNNFYEIGGINPTDYKPATKEQRDTLFARMKEAGYEWDAEKKELKKIDFNPDDLIEESHQQQADDLIDMVTEKSAEWSEEDDDMLYKVTAVINRLCSEGKEYVWSVNTLKKLFYWFKSLKDRVQHQSTWKPSELQMKALKETVDEHFDIDGGALWHLYEDLKKLMEE